MKEVWGERTLPNAEEVETIHRMLCYPKTVTQISDESGMHPSRVVSAMRILSFRRMIVEVDTDPEVFVRVRA